jgi:PAS domain S-box-containing protein
VRVAADRFRTVFERNPVGILLLDDDGRVRDANPSASALTGYARDEIVGRSLGELVHPEDAPLVRDAAVQLFTGEIAEYEVTIRAVTKDGQIVRLAQLATAVRDPGGRAVGALAVIHPVAGDGAGAQ